MVGGFYYPGVDVPYCRDTENRDFYKILYQMYLEFHGKRKNYEKIIEGMLFTLNQYLVSFLNQKPKNPWADKLERMLIDNLHNPDITVGEVMRRLPVDADYLRRLFVRESGRTPSRYLADLRINHAKQLLDARYGRIRDIALMCGYRDPYYFSRSFRKTTGKSPSGWLQTRSSGR
jgi:AraC-like DNA-binding protein